MLAGDRLNLRLLKISTFSKRFYTKCNSIQEISNGTPANILKLLHRVDFFTTSRAVVTNMVPAKFLHASISTHQSTTTPISSKCLIISWNFKKEVH